MSTATDLTAGTAAALAAAGVGTYDGGPYAPDAVRPIFEFQSPPAPDEALTVYAYPRPAPHEHAVQVRCRGPVGGVGAASDIADDVRAVLHGLRDLTWGGTELALLSFASVGLLGHDSNDRDEVTVNFVALTSDPSTSLVDLD